MENNIIKGFMICKESLNHLSKKNKMRINSRAEYPKNYPNSIFIESNDENRVFLRSIGFIIKEIEMKESLIS